MRLCAAAFAGTLVLAIAPAVAGAETISESGGTITIQSAPGEASDLGETPNATNFRFSENGTKADGSPLTVAAGPGCTAVAGQSIQIDCPAAGVTKVVATLGDLDDEAFLEQLPATVSSVVDAGSGNDDIVTGPGNDTLAGGTGDDQLQGNLGNDTLDGGPGNDQLLGDAFSGPGGNDVLTGDSGDDRLVGGAGNDTMDGGEGNDTLSADPGNDTISGGPGEDDTYDTTNFNEDQTISLDGIANDTSAATGVDNVLPDVEDVRTGGGNDTITGSAANNDIFTGNGDNVVDGGDGADEIELGSGNDVANGGAGPDDIFGENGNDTLDGGAGDDLVNGGAGTDQLSGSDGSDTLVPGTGADVVSGGPGTDTVDYSDSEEWGGVSVSLDGVANDGEPGEGQNIGTDVENVIGTSLNDVITGSAASNVLDGNFGDDVLNSRDGSADVDVCGPGDDRVIADGLDTIDASSSLCESVDLGSLAGLGPNVAVVISPKVSKTVSLTATCMTAAVGYCQSAVTLRASGRVIGTTSFVLRPAESETETVALTPTTLKSLAKHRSLKVTATIISHDQRGATQSSTQTATLRAAAAQTKTKRAVRHAGRSHRRMRT